MNAHVSIPDDAAPLASTQGLLARQVGLLERLAEAGVALAEAIAARGIAAEAGTADAETAMAFSRVARAVRMTALLQARLIEDMDRAERRSAFDRESAARRAQDDAEEQAEGHKGRVEAIVARVARGQGHDEEQIERLIGEAAERLDDEDIYGEVLARPVGELVSLICRDLGLEPDWDQLGQEAWAQAEGITSPVAVAMVGGGPLADPGAKPGEERGVVGAGHITNAHPGFSERHLHPSG